MYKLPEITEMVNLARQDLSQRLGVDIGRVPVVGVEKVNWSDSSLGCPQPDMVYAPAITPGFRITLSVNEQKYFYHCCKNGRPFLCEHPKQLIEVIEEIPEPW